MKTRCEHCGYYGGTHETQCPDSEATRRRAGKDYHTLLAQIDALAEQVEELEAENERLRDAEGRAQKLLDFYTGKQK